MRRLEGVGETGEATETGGVEEASSRCSKVP
jgi:hypothetical protein